MRAVGESSDRPGVTQDPRGGDNPDSLDLGEGSSAGCDGHGDPLAVGGQLGVQTLDVVQEITGQVLADRVGVRPHRQGHDVGVEAVDDRPCLRAGATV